MVGHVRIAHARCQFGQRIEHCLKIERRAADDIEHVGGRGLLLERFAQFVEQPRILDGDHRLIREGSDQFDLLVGERLYNCSPDEDYTLRHFPSRKSGAPSRRSVAANLLVLEIGVLCIG